LAGDAVGDDRGDLLIDEEIAALDLQRSPHGVIIDYI
jgi:hypothetical protein